MSVYSMDLRRRAVAAMERGERPEDVGVRLEVHVTTLRKWRRRAEAGRLAPDRCGAKATPVKLTAADLEAMEREVKKRPGVTLLELTKLIGNKVVESTVCRAMRRLGYRYKKSRWWPESNSGPTSPPAG